SNENRAAVYALLLDELEAAAGPDKAAEIMKRAIYKRGEQIGERFGQYAPGDFEGLRDAFVGGIPDQGRMFAPEVVSCNADGLVVEFSNCPLKNAWRKMGLSEARCAKLCGIARVVDNGTFESAGFDFEVRSLPEGEERCSLVVRPRK
ncbi:MAG: L-2-amino-thiazoline-4-carboxylic acid hydrolase, partial [Desulfovibrionaceae bacterium]